MAVSGLSTLGMELGVGAYSASDTGPANAFTKMGRINAIGEINLDQEKIDSSALVDKVSQYVEGRSDSGGEWSVTVNVTNDTIAEWEAIKNTDKWFEVYHPNLTKAWFIAAHIPDKLPLPAMGQNELLTMELSLVIKTYYGFGNAVAPTDSSGGSTT